MKLKVNFNGEILSYDVNENKTFVRDILSRIEAQYKIEVGIIDLQLDNIILCRDKFLSKCINENNLTESSTIMVYSKEIIVKVNSLILINDQIAPNIFYDIKIRLIDNLSQLKAAISNKCKSNTVKFDLEYNGQVLKNNDFLCNYGLKSNDVITLIKPLMKLRISFNGEILSFDIDENKTFVRDIISQIASKYKIEVGIIDLQLDNIILCRDKLFSKYTKENHLTESSTIVVYSKEIIVKVKSTMVIIDQITPNRFYDIKIRLIDNVRQLKAYISNKFNSNSADFDLKYNGLYLMNSDYLCNYGMKSDNVITLIKPLMKLRFSFNGEITIYSVDLNKHFVKNLLISIAAKYKIEVGIIDLQLDNIILCRDKLFTKYIKENNLTESSTIVVCSKEIIVKARLMAAINDQIVSNRFFDIKIRLIDTVRQLKAVILNRMITNDNGVNLEYEGEVLKDDKLLCHYGMRANSVVTVMTTVNGGHFVVVISSIKNYTF